MKVSGHIVVGDAARAAAWDADAFGAVERSRVPLPGGRVMTVDPFGHRWNVAQRVRAVPHEDIVAAAARAFAEE